MKKLIVALALAAMAVPSFASDFSSKLGLDYSSVGGIIVHDFNTAATVSGVEWDAVHLLYKNTETAEAGAYLGKRDIDSHIFVGPSIGTPMGSLATFATNLHALVDWPFLTTVEDYGQYVHAYFNLGYDATRIQYAHLRPDLIGFGGVLKFQTSSGPTSNTGITSPLGPSGPAL